MGRGEDLLGFGEERAEQRAVQPQGSFLVSCQEACEPISAVADGSLHVGTPDPPVPADPHVRELAAQAHVHDVLARAAQQTGCLPRREEIVGAPSLLDTHGGKVCSANAKSTRQVLDAASP